jgi:hypothetical protein
MTPPRPALVLLIPVFILALVAAPRFSRAEAVGAYALPDQHGNCNLLTGPVERLLPGYDILPEHTYAFNGGRMGGAMCFQTLFPQNGEFLEDAALMITELGGHPLQELTTPQRTADAPLEDCWHGAVGFEDFNGDEMPDILLLISCYNAEAGGKQHDNVVYLSEEREHQVWLAQREELNRVVAPCSDFQSAKAALASALSPGHVPQGDAGAVIEAVPLAPQSPQATQAKTKTCAYDTRWGRLTMTFDYMNNTVSGEYDYKNGTISGRLQGDTVTGTWTQRDGDGNFMFQLQRHGFTGVWSYAGDTQWRGNWDGELIDCRR